MARVTCFQVPGIRMLIPSGDHRPPHFHASRPGEWSAKVFFLEPADQMIQAIRPLDATIRGRDRRTIVRGVEANRQALLEEACQT